MRTKNFFLALSVFMGTIIGVGLFSLPYVTSKVGLWIILGYFLILGIVNLLISLYYGEVVLRTKGKHRNPGYAYKYLGKWGRNIDFLATGLGLTGAILAYLVVGGGFLASLLSPILGGSYTLYVLIYFAIGALLIFYGISSIAKAELVLLVFFNFVLVFIFARGLGEIKIANWFASDMRYLFLPYGPILFSLSTAGVIPEIKEMLGQHKQDLKKVIMAGSLLVVIIYLFFILTILGITGANTSEEAIHGLKGILGNGVIALALVFGLIATFTSFLTIGLTLKKTLMFDAKIKERLAWLIACFLPLALFFMGLKDFIKIIALAGGVALAARAIIVILTYLKARKKSELKPAYSLKLPNLIAYLLIIFFIIGIVYEIMYFV